MDSILNNSTYFNYKITKSTDGTNYTDVSTGDFTTANTSDDFVVLTEDIPNNTNNPYYYKVYIWINEDNTDQSSLQNQTFNAEFKATIRPLPLLYNIIAEQAKSTPPSNFSTPATTAENSGVYKTTQDNTDIYYYRGAVKDNNVLYGGYCWKILRTTKTGGIKMIYNGLPNGNNCGTDTTTSQSDSLVLLDGTNEYYQMTYSVSGDSHASNPDFRLTSLRTQLDTWFTNNVNTSLLEEADFCIDAQMDETITDDHQYTAWTRYIGDSTNPTLDCTGTNREVYTSKVGLITMDEAVFAGAPKVSASNNYHGSNNNFYLHNGKGYWTMSPAKYDSSYWNLKYIGVSKWGKLDNYWYGNQSELGLRPVISLAPNALFTGNGTYNNPYKSAM